jgi:transcriptional regulator with XRE-family HTH domain
LAVTVPPQVAERFGRNVLRCRRSAGLSQERLAARAGLHRSEIGLIENGGRLPRVDTLVRLVGSLSVTPEELLKGIVWEPDGRRASSGRFALGPLRTGLGD